MQLLYHAPIELSRNKASKKASRFLSILPIATPSAVISLRGVWQFGSLLGQLRIIWQEDSARIFAPIQSSENGGILYVPARGYAASVSQLVLATAAQYFPFFQTEEVGHKDG